MPDYTKTLGFGFIPTESGHHFLVTISNNKKEKVYISEHLIWEESEGRRELSIALGQDESTMRVILSRSYWDAIADAVRVEFNERLRKIGLKPALWKAGQIPVSRLLGKELVLLAWSIEDADPSLIHNAIKNWLGLAPEERWWLFTMTNAATGHAVNGRNKGWRKAVRYALTENPISGSRPQALDIPLFRLAEEDALWSSSSEPASHDRSLF